MAIVLTSTALMTIDGGAPARALSADYPFVDLGKGFIPDAVNAHNVVAGGVSSPELWNNGVVTELPLPTGAVAATPREITADGLVEGSVSYQNQTPSSKIVRWAAGSHAVSDPASFGTSSNFVVAGDQAGGNLAVYAANADGTVQNLVLGPDGQARLTLPIQSTHYEVLGVSSTTFVAVNDPYGTPTYYVEKVAGTGRTDLAFEAAAMASDGTVAGPAGSVTDVRSASGTVTSRPLLRGYLINARHDLASYHQLLPAGASTPIDLLSLLPSGWSLANGGFNALGDNGSAVGIAVAPDGFVHGFLLKAADADELTISDVTISPREPATADAKITVTVTVRNDTAHVVTAIGAGLTSTTPSTVTVVSAPGPHSVASLARGASTSFTATLKPHAAGAARLSITAHALHGGTSITATPRVRTFTVSSFGLRVELSAVPRTPHPNVPTTITATITNTGARTVTGITSTLSGAPTATLHVGLPSPATVASLAGGASTTVTWTASATADANYTLSDTTTYSDPVDGARSRRDTLILHVVDLAPVVNDTGDGSLTSQAAGDNRCDADDAAAGDQCTLRAAIQLSNTLGADGGDASISFDIPGAGVPVISPTTALPALAVPTTVDGSTQAGGWIRLSGAGAGGADGLTVTGGSSTVRGFVLGGWRTAVHLTGAAGDTVAGNRIGTDPTGTSADANETGISIGNDRDTIGALATDDPTTCDGDCNVISGNSQVGIGIDGEALPARVRIVGNVVGADVTGTAALPNGTAIGLGWLSLTTGHGTTAADAIDIGGRTSRTGLAPGNLIVGAVRIGYASDSHDPGYRFALVRVQGNLIGANRTGDATLGNEQYELSDTDVFDLVGGPAPGDGNTVVGAAGVGILTGAITQGNRVGIGLDGAPLPNKVGIGGDDGNRVCGNVISGNDIGVEGVNLAGGNRIGTDATGERAVPNRIGIGTTAFHGTVSVTSDRCPSSSVDVVSGNTEAAAENVHTLSLRHAYLGTDPSGTKAVPNGAGIIGTTGDSTFTTLGGDDETDAGRGSPCRYPCVVIAGNSGPALDRGVTGSGESVFAQLLDTAIGFGADGRALPNGGTAGVRLSGHVVANHDGIVGNRIGHVAGPAIDLAGPAEGTDGAFRIERNHLLEAGRGVELADGSAVRVADNVIDEVTDGVVADGGKRAPELRGNSLSAVRGRGYVYPTGTTAIGVPAAVSAIRVGRVFTIKAATPSSLDVSSYRIDVYGDVECSPHASGQFPLGSFTVRTGLLDATFEGEVIVPDALVNTVRGVSITATDTSSAIGHTGRYTACTAARVPTQRVTISAPSAAPGGYLTTHASGFLPGEQVEVVLHSTPVRLRVARADKHGRLALRVRLPTSTRAGRHVLVLTGATSHATARVRLVVHAVKHKKRKKR